MISSELVLGEAAVLELEGMRMENPGNLAALLTAHSEEVLLDPRPDSKMASEKAEPRTLYLQREADYLLNALSPECILRVDGRDPQAVYREMAARIAAEHPDITANVLFDQIIEKETTAPSTLGHGVALPHAKLDHLTRTICAVALVPEGLELGTEEEPVRLVFMVASPPDKPEMHLAVLGEIARLCAVPEVRDQLVGESDPERVLPLIRRYRRQHTPFADARG
jgi:mannitol/fructose-specific phosphotransferase system IIA component (Ntr-type)